MAIFEVWCLLLVMVGTVRAQDCATTCENGGTCMADMGSFQCMCAMGWVGPTCEDRESCSPNPCENGGTCSPQAQGSYNCTCSAGATGNRCQNFPCMPNPCGNGGTCRLQSGSYNCTCPTGYTGMTCSNTIQDPCQPNPCKNGGTCSPQAQGSYDCNCQRGFTGNNCQNSDQNACQPNPCQNGGMCSQSQGSYDCKCPTGVMGNNCQLQDPCQSNPCENGGTCSSQAQGSYNCNCPADVTGNNCQNGPGGGITTSSTIIIVVAVVVVVLIVVLAIAIVYLFKRSRSMRNRRNHESDQELKRQASFNNYISGGRRASDTTFASSVRAREFPRDKLHLFGQVGSGSFAVVYKAAAQGIVHKGSNTTVAVKMLKESATPNDKSDFKKELKLYSTLDRHPNVLSMLGCCTDADPMYIILEYVPHGNLQCYLRHIRTGTEPIYLNKPEFKKSSLSPQEILNFACQIVRGMEYLAAKQCIHRDLATRNILLGEGLVCKVSDFGLARDVAEENQYEMKSQGRVPVRWMAPESLISNMYTSKSDVWSFGVLLWELVTLGSHPYPGMTSQKVINELKKGYRLPRPDHCSEDIYKVMTDCWQEQPDDRPDFAQLHMRLDDLLADATGYLEMANLNQDDYMYLEPGQASSVESS